jgi:hypothetical protein
MIAMFRVVKAKAKPCPLSFSTANSLGYISQELNIGLLKEKILWLVQKPAIWKAVMC